MSYGPVYIGSSFLAVSLRINTLSSSWNSIRLQFTSYLIFVSNFRFNNLSYFFMRDG